MNVCEICGKPTIVGVEHPEAKVYHLECLMQAMAPVRDQLKDRSHEHTVTLE
jgi:hypothetical protein